MEQFERDAVVEVIEQLVAELGVDAVPEEVDVTGVLEILTRTGVGENSESQEEGATITVETQATDEAAEAVATAE